MPFLRVVRDKRGYETTYLMHWYREGNRQHSRILYVFRTPGGTRVGREPFEPEVLRQIEAQHPEIDFDWTVVRDNQQVIEPGPEPRRRRPPRREADEAVAAPVPEAEPAAAAPTPPAAAAPSIPAAIQGQTADEQIAFLTQWLPLVRQRIAARTPDPARLATLLALAERLDPSGWTDADQIAAGLQSASEALERLAHILGKRRRRPRRKPGAPGGAAPPRVNAGDGDRGETAPADAAADSDDTSDEEGADD